MGLTIRAILRDPEEMGGTFVAMVEENEVRANLSHFERGRIAVLSSQEGAFVNPEAPVDAPAIDETEVAKADTAPDAAPDTTETPPAPPEHTPSEEDSVRDVAAEDPKAAPVQSDDTATFSTDPVPVEASEPKTDSISLASLSATIAQSAPERPKVEDTKKDPEESDKNG